MRRYRTSDRVRLILISDPTTLTTEELEFFDRVGRRLAESGLEPICDFWDTDGAGKAPSTIWRVPDTRLFVSAHPTHWPPHQPEAFSVYIRNGAPNRVSVTTDYLHAYRPCDFSKEFGVRVMSPAWPLPFLIGYVWALGVKLGHSFDDPLPPETHIMELEKAYTEHFRRLIDDGYHIPDGPDQYRASMRWSLLIAANYIPLVARFAIARRWKRWQRDLDSVSDLLPASFYEAKWIIAAVQDRVRTGSTAPLTQP